jgi:uncharacterized protein (DUF4415 family)
MDFETTDKTSSLAGFREAAQSAAPVRDPPKIMVSLQLDADLLAHFQSETAPRDWQRHVNDVLRFYVESSQLAEADAELSIQMAQQEGPKP